MKLPLPVIKPLKKAESTNSRHHIVKKCLYASTVILKLRWGKIKKEPENLASN